MKTRLSILLLLFMVATVSFAQGLRESVCIVEAEYTDEEKDQIGDLSLWFSRKGFMSESRLLSAYKSGVTGSGVVVETDYGRYVLSNRHVVGYAREATISFVLKDTTLVYEHCAVKAVSHNEDLVLVCLPDSCTQPAIELSTEVIEDGQDIVAAGFPGLAGKPSWQVTKGSVSNANLRIEEDNTVYIQHTAPIDPGSSGGPLLIKHGDTYQIVGVNTYKAFWRDNVGITIPVDAVSRFISTVGNDTLAESGLAAITINGETWAKMVDKMEKECIDSLRNMQVDMPLDVLTNTLSLECTPEVVSVVSKTSSSSSNNSKPSKSKVYVDDFGKYNLVRLTYTNMLSKNQNIGLSWEQAHQWLSVGFQVFVGFEEWFSKEEEITKMRSAFSLGLKFGLQVPLKMGKKYYAIPRLLFDPYFSSSAILGFFNYYNGPEEIGGFPFSLGCDFAFPVGDYLLSVGVYYQYLIQLFPDDYSAETLCLSKNRALISKNAFTTNVGQSGLGVSLAFWW